MDSFTHIQLQGIKANAMGNATMQFSSQGTRTVGLRHSPSRTKLLLCARFYVHFSLPVRIGAISNSDGSSGAKAVDLSTLAQSD